MDLPVRMYNSAVIYRPGRYYSSSLLRQAIVIVRNCLDDFVVSRDVDY